MDPEYWWHEGWWFVWLLPVFIVVLFGLVMFRLRWHGAGNHAKGTARDILDRRYANGELSLKQ